MNIKKIKAALYNALKNDFAIKLFYEDKHKVIFSFYPLDNVYNGLARMFYDETGKLNADDCEIDFQYMPKTKKAENLIKKFAETLNGATPEQINEFNPIFEYYKTQAKKIYYAKYSINIDIYTNNEDIKNYREV